MLRTCLSTSTGGTFKEFGWCGGMGLSSSMKVKWSLRSLSRLIKLIGILWRISSRTILPSNHYSKVPTQLSTASSQTSAPVSIPTPNLSTALSTSPYTSPSLKATATHIQTIPNPKSQVSRFSTLAVKSSSWILLNWAKTPILKGW